MPEMPRLIGLRSRVQGWIDESSEMSVPSNDKPEQGGPSRRSALGLILGAPLVASCSSLPSTFSANPFSSSNPDQPPAPAGPPQQPVDFAF